MTSWIPARWTPYLLSLLRIVAALNFLTHGTQKLFGFPPAEGRGPVALTSLPGVAGILEFLGGSLLLVGLFTRPVAFILAGEMAVAYFLAHAGRGFWPIVNMGELAALYCFLWLYICGAGPGAWSIDAALRRNRTVI